MKRLRIAQISPELRPVPPVKGGAIQTLIYNLACVLKNDFDIKIFSRPDPSQIDDPLDYEPIFPGLIEKIADNIINSKAGRNKIARFLARGVLEFLYGLKCAHRLKDYDIIHIHNSPHLVPLIKRFAKRSKIILHMHNFHFTRSKYLVYLKKLYKKSIKQSDFIIGVSPYVVEEIKRDYPLAEGKIAVIENGIEIDKFFKRDKEINFKTRKKYSIASNKVLILYVGRLVKEKGVHIIMDALNMLPKNFYQFIIVGRSFFGNPADFTSYEKYLFNRAKELKNSVKFLGHIKREELPFLYSTADIFVLASKPGYESCPLTILEAMACECAVLSSIDIAVEDGVNGIVFEYNNVKELAINLRRLIESKELRKRLAKNARKTVEEKYTTKKNAEKIKELYLQIIR